MSCPLARVVHVAAQDRCGFRCSGRDAARAIPGEWSLRIVRAGAYLVQPAANVRGPHSYVPCTDHPGCVRGEEECRYTQHGEVSYCLHPIGEFKSEGRDGGMC